MHPLLEKLRGGDRRSIGRSDEVVSEVLAAPSLFPALFDGILVDDTVLRMRCADAAEKITRSRPDLIAPFKSIILSSLGSIAQAEVRWHLVQMLPRLDLDIRQARKAASTLALFIADPAQSSIVRTFSMQALADLASSHPKLRPLAAETIADFAPSGTPAMKSRARKLLALLSEP